MDPCYTLLHFSGEYPLICGPLVHLTAFFGGISSDLWTRVTPYSILWGYLMIYGPLLHLTAFSGGIPSSVDPCFSLLHSRGYLLIYGPLLHLTAFSGGYPPNLWTLVTPYCIFREGGYPQICGPLVHLTAFFGEYPLICGPLVHLTAISGRGGGGGSPDMWTLGTPYCHLWGYPLICGPLVHLTAISGGYPLICGPLLQRVKLGPVRSRGREGEMRHLRDAEPRL